MITNPTIRFYVGGVPVPQGSKRAFVVKGKVVIADVKSTELKKWRTRVAAVAVESAAAWGLTDLPIDGPLEVRLGFELAKPATVKRSHPSVAPDIDKLSRALLDALTQSGVIKDDARIVRLVAEKVYAPQPGVWVSIREIAGEKEEG